MKPSDVYNYPFWKTPYDQYDIYNLVGNGHVPEVDQYGIDHSRNDRITTRIYHDPYIDGERGHRLSAAFLDGRPVMVMCDAGRGNQDHNERYVTDAAAYAEMVKYLQTLYTATSCPEAYDPDTDIPHLDHFYGRDVTLGELN